jgi:LacI family transcriptional regulator
VTVKSIAKEAGVSIGSVSSVLNNRHIERRISAATVQKIREASVKLGYLPNISARRLRSGTSTKNHVVLALITSFEAPIPLINHFISALRGAIADERNLRSDLAFSMMIEMYVAGRLRELPGLLTGDHFNAAIIMNTIAEDDQFLTRAHLPYPVVLVNRTVPGFASVVEDESSGVRAAENR